MNTTEFLTISSAIVPDRLAVVYEDRRITYERLQERVNRLANALAGLGVGPGDRVAMLQVNCNQHVEAYFAAAKLDAVYVPLQFRTRADELAFTVNDAGPVLLMAGERYVELVKSLADDMKSVREYIALEGPTDGWYGYEDLVEAAPNEEHFPSTATT